jgi:hypothetical protein
MLALQTRNYVHQSRTLIILRAEVTWTQNNFEMQQVKNLSVIESWFLTSEWADIAPKHAPTL